MAYVIVSQPRAWWPIRFNGVTEDGEIVTNEIRGRFNILDEDAYVEFRDDVAQATGALAAATSDDERRKLSEILSPFFMRILEDWEHVVEEDKSSVPFSQSNLERMLRVPNFASGVSAAHVEVRAADPELRKGN